MTLRAYKNHNNLKCDQGLTGPKWESGIDGNITKLSENKQDVIS